MRQLVRRVWRWASADLADVFAAKVAGKADSVGRGTLPW